MLTQEEITDLIGTAWQLQLSERVELDKIHRFVRGKDGYPVLPEDAEAEVKEIARHSIRNVLSLVRDAFCNNLSVVGYRTATASENDAAWAIWQRNKMDARQGEIHRAAITYGTSYVVVSPGSSGPVFRPRSPRQMIALYSDPSLDDWPAVALETWVSIVGGRRRRVGRLYDAEFIYPLDLGELALTDFGTTSEPSSALTSNGIRPVGFGDVIPHRATSDGEPVCPVVRYPNGFDSDNPSEGEVIGLIDPQIALNNVNFERAIASRFGAWPQKVISGWTGTRQEVLQASARKVWTFADEDVKAQSFPPAALEGYNALVEEMTGAVLTMAQVSPVQGATKIINVSAEALAAAEAQQQRKISFKQECLGERHEQLLRLAAEMDGDTATAADSGAEVMWRDYEARTFAGVVDGVTKLAAQGVPIEELLVLVPGLTQQQITGIKAKMRGTQATARMDSLRATAAALRQPAVPAALPAPAEVPA